MTLTLADFGTVVIEENPPTHSQGQTVECLGKMTWGQAINLVAKLFDEDPMTCIKIAPGVDDLGRIEVWKVVQP